MFIIFACSFLKRMESVGDRERGSVGDRERECGESMGTGKEKEKGAISTFCFP
jgi:hypothetical protein